jgi:precorrin-8X/cobalt-precorrin-8 methylmutase
MFTPEITAPASIEEKSFQVIDAELSPHFRFTPDEHAVVRRVIHATADFEYARNLRFHPGSFDAFRRAMQAKADIICDVQMVMAGVSKAKLALFGGQLLCPIADEDVAAAAKAAGHTRAMEAMRKMARRGNGGVLAIGNAPTALTEAIRLVREAGWRPDLIIGMPVGFVSAAESKDSLAAGDALDVPYITTLGRKGGSPCVVSCVNALLLLAEGKTAIKG